jgi:enoyl-CoA hydratase/carnithine racemase
MTPMNKVIIEERGQVLLIGLNRPEKYNAFDHDTWHEVARAYKLLESSSNLHCGLVYANGKHFTAGLDLPEWTDVFSSGEWPAIPPDECDPLGLRPEHRCRKPIVMAIHGICYTIGMSLPWVPRCVFVGEELALGRLKLGEESWPAAAPPFEWFKSLATPMPSATCLLVMNLMPKPRLE